LPRQATAPRSHARSDRRNISDPSPKSAHRTLRDGSMAHSRHSWDAPDGGWCKPITAGNGERVRVSSGVSFDPGVEIRAPIVIAIELVDKLEDDPRAEPMNALNQALPAQPVRGIESVPRPCDNRSAGACQRRRSSFGQGPLLSAASGDFGRNPFVDFRLDPGDSPRAYRDRVGKLAVIRFSSQMVPAVGNPLFGTKLFECD
jgi:hypothetical protein